MQAFLWKRGLGRLAIRCELRQPDRHGTAGAMAAQPCLQQGIILHLRLRCEHYAVKTPMRQQGASTTKSPWLGKGLHKCRSALLSLLVPEDVRCVPASGVTSASGALHSSPSWPRGTCETVSDVRETQTHAGGQYKQSRQAKEFSSQGLCTQ